MLKLCVAGIAGRMGQAILHEIVSRGFQLTGAVEGPNSPYLGKNLRELGLLDSNIVVAGPSKLPEAVKDADVYLTFTTPEAELQNIPTIVDLEKKQLWPKSQLKEQLAFIDSDVYCRRLIESHLILYKKYEELEKKLQRIGENETNTIGA